MIIFGGHASNNATPSVFNDGGLYDPATNTWQPITQIGAPSPRSGYTAVWTGTKLIVFGGSSSDTGVTTYLNDGGIYDLATNTWQPITQIGAPSPRSGHTAVWTGAKMIIFGGAVGGASNFIYHNSGAAYDPVTNSWLALDASNAPSPRSSHTAVWTGTKMMVFGGLRVDTNSVFTWFNDGGIYDPSTNRWESLPATGTLEGRYGHSAVWSGAKMIVFGGQGRTSGFGDGAMYDPVTSSWQSINMSGAPGARASHTSVWTGTKMIVFGGSSNGLRGDGGIFDPLTNSWQTLNLNGAPGVRYQHSAVWDGTKMIVFGGITGFSNNTFSYSNDGAIFE